MKHVTYGAKSVFVEDRIAHAVMDYARALASGAYARADTVTVPVLNADGDRVQATFLLSPSIALAMESSHAPFDAPSDPAVVAEIAARTAALRTPRARPLSRDDLPSTPPHDI